MYRYLSFWGITVPAYGVCLMLAIVLCTFLAIRRAKQNQIMVEDMLILAAVSVGSALLGAGLLYMIVTYKPSQLYQWIKNGDVSFLFNGGLVFYGGLIGGVAGAWICSNRLRLQTESIEQCIVPYIPLGHAIGRVGCLLAGCCYGFEYDGVFAVRNIMLSEPNTYFPIQAVEAILDLGIMAILLVYTQKLRCKHKVIALYLSMYAILRFLLEFFRGDGMRGSFWLFSTSQWISIGIVTLCIIVRLYGYGKKR